MRFAHRFAGEGQRWEGLTVLTNQGPRWTGKIKLEETQLLKPLSWKKRRMVFVNSMSDLFHEDVPFEYVDNVFAVMALTPQHTYQILTKRANRMQEYLSDPDRQEKVCRAMNMLEEVSAGYPLDGSMHIAGEPLPWPLRNVWLGVSVENQKTADERIPLLLETPAAIRWLSIEPLLGYVGLNLARCLNGHGWVTPELCNSGKDYCCPHCHAMVTRCSSNSPGSFFQKRPIDWIVCGGESSFGARPMNPNWARDVRDQAIAADIPFFFKQWGEWSPHLMPNDQAGKDMCLFGSSDTPLYLKDEGAVTRQNFYADAIDGCLQPGVLLMQKLGKRRAGRILDDREWNQMPEVRS